MKKILFYIFSSVLILAGCERDDICAESTPITPLLVIEFFDADNPSEEKIPTDLFIAEEGAPIGLTFNAATISIPLRTDTNQTRFDFIINAGSEDGDDPENIDRLIFNYLPQEEFVSKACGFRVIYQAIQDDFNTLDDGPWIDNVNILNATIEDDTEAHIRIFH